MNEFESIERPLVVQVPEAGTPPTNNRVKRTHVAAGLFALLLGMLILLGASIHDARMATDAPWGMAFILFDAPEDLPDMETYPVRLRLVSRPIPLESDLALEALGRLISWERFDSRFRMTDPEHLIAVELPESTQQKLLVSGRLPEPGQPEVLAGSLARDNSFWVDNIEFEVVGRLSHTVSGFLFAYMLPAPVPFADLFSDARNAAAGVLVVDGESLIEADLLPSFLYVADDASGEDGEAEEHVEETGTREEEDALALPPYLGGLLMAPQVVTYATFGALILIALGGSLLYHALFMWLRGRRYRMLLPALDEVAARPGLFWGMHFFLYGVFFLCMRGTLDNPLLTYRITQYIGEVFSHGGLGYVGAAYASGNVNHAALATFYNNYIEQTLGLTFLISLFPIPLGLIKNVLSFALVGAAMTPLWVGSSATYLLHALTMALELEAYIVACFAITAWPLKLGGGLRDGSGWKSVKSGLLMLLSFALVAGVMLAIASYYEAYTLIHLI